MSDPNIREAEPATGSEAPAKRFKFPTALTVLAIVLLLYVVYGYRHSRLRREPVA